MAGEAKMNIKEYIVSIAISVLVATIIFGWLYFLEVK